MSNNRYPTDTSQRFKRNLAARMEAEGYTLSALAKKMGVTPVAISYVVRGDEVPTLDRAEAIARAVDTTLVDLLR